jgi:hypothetical protein
MSAVALPPAPPQHSPMPPAPSFANNAGLALVAGCVVTGEVPGEAATKRSHGDRGKDHRKRQRVNCGWCVKHQCARCSPPTVTCKGRGGQGKAGCEHYVGQLK